MITNVLKSKKIDFSRLGVLRLVAANFSFLEGSINKKKSLAFYSSNLLKTKV